MAWFMTGGQIQIEATLPEVEIDEIAKDIKADWFIWNRYRRPEEKEALKGLLEENNFNIFFQLFCTQTGTMS